MNLFPFYQDIEGKQFLVVGAGNVAKQKIAVLLKFTSKGRIRVISPKGEELDVPVQKKCFEVEDLNGVDVCIAATSDLDLNTKIAGLCQQRHIPVNVVDVPELCSFVFPSIVKDRDLTIAISTNGKCPVVAKYLRQEMEEMLPSNMGEILNILGDMRQEMKERYPLQKDRSAAYFEKLQELLNEYEEPER